MGGGYRVAPHKYAVLLSEGGIFALSHVQKGPQCWCVKQCVILRTSCVGEMFVYINFKD